MIYGDKAIRALVAAGRVQNCREQDINPASHNVRLGTSFTAAVSSPNGIRLGDRIQYITKVIGDTETYVLNPGGFVLATTMESIDLPADCAAFVQGRSSIGRAGLSVQNAGFVDPGFHGHITLELKNETRDPIILRPGYPVAQLVFMSVSEVEHPYEGKYNDQVEATGSRMWMDKDAQN